MSTTKTSVSLPDDIYRWAVDLAEREGSSVSAVLAEGVAHLRRRRSWERVRDKLLRGKPLTEAELGRAVRELGG